MSHQISSFGTHPNGQEVQAVHLKAGSLSATILTYGATVQDLRMDGHAAPLVLGAPLLEPYLDGMTYFGALVGRFANRIANGQFTIDGEHYQVPPNWIGKHTLHGGEIGTGQRLWKIEELPDERSVRMKLTLSDGEMGFPGTLQAEALITLDEDCGITFHITAISDAATPCSFAHHGYFNLDGSQDITQHELQISADAYLPVDADLIPTGEVASVANTPFDFRTATPIGKRCLDHNFCLTGGIAETRDVARLFSAKSGIEMTVSTNQPGLQVYDAAHIPKDGLAGLNGRRYGPYAGIALETQSWPDAPNQPKFPNALLRPSETYRHVVRYGFARRA